MMRTLAVVLKPQAPQAPVALAHLQKLCPQIRFISESQGHHGLDRDIPGVDRVSPEEMQSEADMVVALGGDGTLLHAASLLPNRRTPILGINLGFIGFLTEVTREEVDAVLPMALAGELPYTDRMRLRVEVWRNGELALSRVLLNEVAVTMRNLARIADFHVADNKELMTTVRGDGVMVCTPTGSTAYSLAAGGPIVAPQLEAFVVTPICPHQLTQRPLVVPPNGELRLTLASNSSAFVSLDGHVGHPFVQGDAVVVRRAEVPTRLLRVPWRSHYQTLRTKLSWGEG